MKISEMCEAERPREKMLSRGAASLSTGELLAVLLRSGTAGRSALELAQMLLKAADGSIVTLSEMSRREICSIPGIKAGKATSVIAALELGRRFLEEKSTVVKKPVVHSRMIFEMMLPRLKGIRHEECWVLLLNNANYVLAREKTAVGGGNSTTIDIPRILRLALDNNASGLILVHNHPSGSPRPSNADILYTENLKKAATPFGISLLDHVVVCDDCFYSFADDMLYKA